MQVKEGVKRFHRLYPLWRLSATQHVVYTQQQSVTASMMIRPTRVLLLTAVSCTAESANNIC